MNADAVNQLVQVLEKTTSGDQNDMKAAQQFLEQAAATNLPQLIRTLSDVLYHGGNSAVCRQQAGVQLKNFLYTNDESLRAQYEERWLNIPEDVRQYTKQNVVGALGTESFRPSAAAQCIHMIAVVELPRGCWPGLITTLVGNVINPSSSEVMKESTLQAIGYVCQDVDHRFLEESANDILTDIVHGMRWDPFLAPLNIWQLIWRDESGDSGSDMFDEQPKKSRAGVIETSESEAEVQPKKSSKKNEPTEVLDLESDSEKENKDEFDVSDSDDGGLAKKVVTQAKKPPPKKLTKSSDLFSDMMAAGGGASKSKPGPASKKLPVPKKPLGQTQKHKKSESESDHRPAKKKAKKVESESEEDMFDAGPPGPPGPRSKTGGRTKPQVSYGFEDSDSSDF